MTDTQTIDINDLILTIKRHLKAAKWSKGMVEHHLIIKYHKERVLQLSDDELLEFVEFCRNLKPSSIIKLRSLNLRVLPKTQAQLKAEIEPPTNF